ncbi:hypothetical protein OF829_03365 [Sphingomonas sp. LB-2]|uniref:ExbD/TolR family protein n=1 Tax=Sphingomonas caeni TaxID=2984949 RepID=UPI00222E3C11|nr:hypothetical protein [Sphingomonas caeni]MCW3846264.1 hypothetical protein [Sphingomonas caeni]
MVRFEGRVVTLAQLRPLLVQVGREGRELYFQPHPDTSYQCVDRVLRVVKRSGVGKLGFIGNEQYSADAPEKPR